MRKLTFDERFLLALQKDPNLRRDTCANPIEWEFWFQRLGIPDTTEQTTEISVESIVVDNLERLFTDNNK